MNEDNLLFLAKTLPKMSLHPLQLHHQHHHLEQVKMEVICGLQGLLYCYLFSALFSQRSRSLQCLK